MKFIARFLYVPLAGLLVLTSCAKDETESVSYTHLTLPTNREV